jgi:predicted ferric reductase
MTQSPTQKAAPALASGIDLEGRADTPAALLAMLIAAAVGAALAVVLLPQFLPALAQSTAGESPKAYWFLSRASGFVAFGLLWLSTAFGLLMTGKLARNWPGHLVAFEAHQSISLLALAFALFHALILLGDRYVGYTLEQVLTPLGSQSYRPLEVGLGQVGFYLTALVTFTFYARRLISQRAWRIIHYLSFVVFVMTLWHGVSSGSDSGEGWAQVLYWSAGGSVLFLTVYRILSARIKIEPTTK